MIYGKSVILGVTGSIAAYKACDVVSKLKKLGADVDVIMTQSATEFVAPLTFETLSKNAVTVDMFAPKTKYDVTHISLAKKADIFVIAPASANIIAKLAEGIADDMLTATYLACTAAKVVCPAMNTNMFNNPVTQENISRLKEKGVIFIEPDEGMLACGDIGRGRLAEPDKIVESIVNALAPVQDYDGKTVLITAGATEENIDGVRVITNHSSGKMGIALAINAAERGAKVILVYGSIKVGLPNCLYKSVKVGTTMDMLAAVEENFEETDIFIMAAAPADYRLKQKFDNKIKSETLTLEFEKNPDIAGTIGKKIKSLANYITSGKTNCKTDGQSDFDGITGCIADNIVQNSIGAHCKAKNKTSVKKLIIFSAETESLIDNATAKLIKKGADMVVANDVTKEGAGFYTDTNIAVIINKKGERTDCGLMLKSELAEIILNKVNLL